MELEQQNTLINQPPSPTATTISNQNDLHQDTLNQNELHNQVSELNNLQTQSQQIPPADVDVTVSEKPGGHSVAVSDVSDMEKDVDGGCELTHSVAGDDVAGVEKSGGELIDSVVVSDVAGTEKDVDDGCELTHSVAGDDVAGVEKSDDGDELTHSVAGDDVEGVEKSDDGYELTHSVAGDDVAGVEKSGGDLTDSVTASEVAGTEKDVDDGDELTHSVANDDVAGVEKHDGGDQLMDSVAGNAAAGEEKHDGSDQLMDSVAVDAVAGVEKHDGSDQLMDSVAGDDVAVVEKHDVGDELMDSVATDDVSGVEKHDGGDELIDSVVGDDVAGAEKHDVLTDSVTGVGEHEQVMTESETIEIVKKVENVEKLENVGMEEGVTENEEEEKMDTHLESDGDEEEVSVSGEEEKVETKMPVKRGGRLLGLGKKRGGKSLKATPKSTGRVKTVKEEGEDVCSICYDGGELVLCDERGCPKAYHHSCIDRDEAFFLSKGKWKCGWHLCTMCMKKAEYMCYTCSFSLCKTCIKNNDILCIREKVKKGFCETCMKNIMAIEKNAQDDQGNIDFDDKNSWEYLFKDHWLDKKAKLNISLDELVEAKNAWKEPDPPAGHSDGGSGSEHPSDNLESQPTKTRRRQSKKRKTHDSNAIASRGTSVPENTEWASKELLEFVMHMGRDKSSQSQFDVQSLLLEYIKINKLRDARGKSQIICDARLQRLFGKPRVGHFEMLKLLESHFLIKEDDDVKGNVVDTEGGPADDDDSETAAKGSKDKKRKTRRKGDRELQSNREDLAAIDTHNINLIYLKRKLAEDLLDDAESFDSKVVGTFVRIRMTGANQKNDLYRLVQVTGTTKGVQYAVGKKMTDTMLEILNLDKKECIPIETISNQDFMEDECRRLRQSIKCGLINRLTVGDILDKAIELQAARVNDWLEAEVLRLSHLRDRASDLGRKKELRECVEKLDVLKTPEERTRRMKDIPVVHDDPTMDLSYESEDNADEDSKKQDIYKSTFGSSFSKRQDYPSKESGRVPRNEGRWDQGRDRSIQPSSVVIPSSENEREKIVALTEDISESGPKVNETEKQWHYRDPAGKIQGPFSMARLRKWKNSNYFPADLRIWRKSEKEGDGILLTGALEGQLHVKIPKPSSNDRHASANLPSPTPNQSLGHVGSPVGPNALVQTGHMVSSPVANTPPQMVQSLAGQNPHSWVGGPTHNPQPSPVAGQQLTYNQWVGGPNTSQNSAGNFLQQPVPPVGPNALVQTGHMVSTPVANTPPQMVQSLAGQNPHSWVGGPTQNPQPSPVVGQQLTYNQWVSGPNMAQNSVGNYLQQTGHMVSPPVVNMPPQMVQSHAVQFPHGWVGVPTHNLQPFPMVGQQLTYNPWVNGPNPVQNSAGNFLQQPVPPTPPTGSWPMVPRNPNMGLPGTTAVSQNVNWGNPQLTGNVDPSWGFQSGSGSVHPGWVPTQPAQGVTPNQGRVPGASSGPTQGPIVSGSGNSNSVGPYNRSGDS